MGREWTCVKIEQGKKPRFFVGREWNVSVTRNLASGCELTVNLRKKFRYGLRVIGVEGATSRTSEQGHPLISGMDCRFNDHGCMSHTSRVSKDLHQSMCPTVQLRAFGVDSWDMSWIVLEYVPF